MTASRFHIVVCACYTTSCSMSLGPVFSESIQPKLAPHLGASASGMLDVSIFDTDANVALGAQTQVFERIKPSSDWGDWRLQALLGVTQMPRRHESFVGYELFATGGIGRFKTESSTDIGVAYGLLGGLPLRLSCYQPPWRADDLAGIQWYLVPALAANGHDLSGFELNATLSIRLAGWSAITP